MANIEFYLDRAQHPFCSVDDAAVPRAGEAISIGGIPYDIDRVTWAVDTTSPDRFGQGRLRANVELSKR